MPAKFTNLLHVPGFKGRVEIDADYEWRELGAILADGFDYEQANLLDALAKGLRTSPEGKFYGGLMQLQYVADHVREHPDEYDIDAVKWLLSELLIRLEDY